ncbi:hypothetical protein MKW92_035541 [Papaver armeniacum]|nr:hypothetical protein MKW92_035541 [Papaver armeniacum]
MERAEKEEADINNLERLPEGCISDILSLTTPADVCRSSLVSTLFKSAADSDALWEKFLPDDYLEIITGALRPFSPAVLSKKDLYYRLCDDPLLIDGGLKSFQLEKCSGKKCIMLGAKELAIDLEDGNIPCYWYWRGYPGSRFAKVAELHLTWWFRIRGKLEIQLLSPKTLYAAYLVLKFKDVVYGFDQPVKAKVELVGRAAGSNSMCSQERHIYLSPNGDQGQYFARERRDGWMEVEIGHFCNEELEDNKGGEVHVILLENDMLVSKTGLIVQGIELRPKVDAQIL